MAGPALMAARAEGKVSPPYGQFPYLEVDGTPLGQSLTMLRFVGKLAGLCPTGDLEAALAESQVEQINDAAGACYAVMFSGATDEEKAKAKEAVMTEKLPALLKGIAAYLGDKAFLGGDSPSIADVMLFAFAEGFGAYGWDWTAASPPLKRVVDSMAAHPKLQAYIAKRAEVEAAEKAASA